MNVIAATMMMMMMIMMIRMMMGNTVIPIIFIWRVEFIFFWRYSCSLLVVEGSSVADEETACKSSMFGCNDFISVRMAGNCVREE